MSQRVSFLVAVLCYFITQSLSANVITLPLKEPPAISIGVGNWEICVGRKDGIECFDNSGKPLELNPEAMKPPAVTNPKLITHGPLGAFCVLDENEVKCWKYETMQVPKLSNPTHIASPMQHTCAVDDSGFRCWGDNQYGQSTPPTVAGAKEVAGGYYFTCGIHEGGISCWGGQTGIKNIPTVTSPQSIVAGGRHACVLDEGNVKCWGRDDIVGKLAAQNYNNATQLTSGDAHICVLQEGEVKCSGSNNYGELNVPSLKNPTLVAAGNSISCAQDDEGIKCWGQIE